MKLGQAKTTSIILLLGALAIGVAANFITAEGSSGYTLSVILVVLMFIAGLACALIWGRCPNCGQRLFINLYKWKKCPRCNKPLDLNGRFTAKPQSKKLR